MEGESLNFQLSMGGGSSYFITDMGTRVLLLLEQFLFQCLSPDSTKDQLRARTQRRQSRLYV